jgi:hypothetical protein
VSTTLPFFRWLVDEPAFADAAFDTTYLDRVLSERGGRPFVVASEAEARDASIAAALAAWFRARRSTSAAPAAAASRWRQAARAESLRSR